MSNSIQIKHLSNCILLVTNVYYNHSNMKIISIPKKIKKFFLFTSIQRSELLRCMHGYLIQLVQNKFYAT